MRHQSETLTQSKMQIPPYLLPRGTRWYFRIKIPADLQRMGVFGKAKDKKVNLKTSDLRAAKKAVGAQLAVWTERFEQERQKLIKQAIVHSQRRRGSESSSLCAIQQPHISILSNEQLQHIVIKHFIELERESEEWLRRNSANLSNDERRECIENISDDRDVYSGSSKVFGPYNPSYDLDCVLSKWGLILEKGSEAYTRMTELLRRARLENATRQLCRLERGIYKAEDPLFHPYNEQSFPPKNVADKSNLTIGQAINDFLEGHEKARKAPGTLRTYRIPARLLKQFFGEDCQVSSIDHQMIVALYDVMEQLPVNAQQRYKGMTLQAAIDEATKRGDMERIGSKTLENYYTNIVQIFKFACKNAGLITNPASDPLFAARFKAKPTKKIVFTMPEVNALFRSTLFINRGGSENKNDRVRNDRFWIPLLALYHGFRSNEVCQLYVEDVKVKEGIDVIWIREEMDNGKKSDDKRLKTTQSNRMIPVHPELQRMGFLNFVHELRQTENHRLFSEISLNGGQYYSTAFGRWFGRFRDATLVESVWDSKKPTMHSFRHMFVTELRRNRVPADVRKILGGWKKYKGEDNDDLDGSEPNYGDYPMNILFEEISKVAYPGVDLSHLHIA